MGLSLKSTLQEKRAKRKYGKRRKSTLLLIGGFLRKRKIAVACSVVTAHAALFGIPAYLIFCRIRKMKKGRTKTVLYSVWGLCVIGLVSITAVSTALGLPAFGPDGRLL